MAINIDNLTGRLELGEFSSRDSSWWSGGSHTSTASTKPPDTGTLNLESVKKLLDAVEATGGASIMSGFRPGPPKDDATDALSFWRRSGRESGADPVDTEREIARAEDMAIRAAAYKRAKAARMETCVYFHRHHQDLCGTNLKRKGTNNLNANECSEALTEILHLANFHREKYGYTRHALYSDHLDGLVGKWDSGFHTELVQCVEMAKSRAAAAALPRPEDDPVDFIPDDALALLANEAERAAKGIW